MSNEQLPPITLPASGDLSASVFCAVTVDTSGNAALPTAGGSILGVLTNKPKALGEPARINVVGTGRIKAVYGGTVTVKDALKVNASGQFITAIAADIAAGQAVAICLKSGSSGDFGEIILLGGASTVAAIGGVQDIVLGTTAPDGSSAHLFVSTTGTVTGVVPNGKYTGQPLRVVQYLAATTPVGTITGLFKNQAGTAKTTLGLGTAVGDIGAFVWDGAAYRQVSSLGGTGASLT